MWLAWIVLVLHVAAFAVPLIGVRSIYRRAEHQFGDAQRVTASARGLLDWYQVEQDRLRELDYGSDERKLGDARLEVEFAERISAAGLAKKTYGDLDIQHLTDGRSNLVAFASAVRIAKSDAFWVVIGLFLGLVANLVPTIWPVPSLVG